MRGSGLPWAAHPLALLRPHLHRRRYLSAGAVRDLADGARVRTAGLVICRQHPGSAPGVVFVTIEDETGRTNLIVWPRLVERQPREVLQARLLAVSGHMQREGEVVHVVAWCLIDETPLLGGLMAASRDFRQDPGCPGRVLGPASRGPLRPRAVSRETAPTYEYVVNAFRVLSSLSGRSLALPELPAGRWPGRWIP